MVHWVQLASYFFTWRCCGLVRDRWIGTLFILLSVLLGFLSACGPAIPVMEKNRIKKEPSAFIESEVVSVSENLNLQILSESKQNASRASINIRRRLNQSLISGIALLEERVENFRLQYSHHRIIVRNILFGNGSRQYYLSWPEEVTGRSILTTSVVHQSLDGNNLWSAESNLGLAFHDRSRHRWIFPVSLLFSERTELLGCYTLESETQLVRLEMSLNSNENIHFEILFRISANAL